MNDEDIKAFLDDFKKADKPKKLDMWFYALEQEGIWEELIAEMSNIATVDQLKSGKKTSSGDE
jgi:hypothetical protein